MMAASSVGAALMSGAPATFSSAMSVLCRLSALNTIQRMKRVPSVTSSCIAASRVFNSSGQQRIAYVNRGWCQLSCAAGLAQLRDASRVNTC